MIKTVLVSLVSFIPPTLFRLYLRRLEKDVALAIAIIIGVLAYIFADIHYLGAICIGAGAHILMRVERQE